MFKKILRACSFLILSIFITSSVFFTSANPLEAIQTIQDNTDQNSLGIIIEENNDVTDGSKTSVVPDLGDDQAFPFIPGFGKNSGKDWTHFLIICLLPDK